MSCLRFVVDVAAHRASKDARSRDGGLGSDGREEVAELSRQSCGRSGRHRLAAFESPAQQRETLVDQAFAIRSGGTVGALELERGDYRRDLTCCHEVWV